MSNVLVVGGAGYVGSVLCPVLEARDHDVTVVDKLWFGNHLPSTIPVIEQDLFDLEDDDLTHFDTVIFLAGLSNDPMADWSPKQNFIANGAGPGYLAFYAKKAGVSRFIHGGSCSVYGNSPGIVCTESTPPYSDFPYGISKINGESAALSMRDEDFSVISLRKGTVCGYSPRMRFDLIINAMARDAMRLGKITVNNPDLWRPILGIHDAVQAYVKAVEAPMEVSGIFNVASGNHTVGEIGRVVRDAVSDVSGRAIDLVVFNRPDKRDYRVSTASAAHTLDFLAQDTLRSITLSVIDGWENYGDVYQTCYSNIETFKKMAAGPVDPMAFDTAIAPAA